MYDSYFFQQVDSSDKGVGMWPYCGVRPVIHSFVSPEFTENDRMPKYSFVRDSSQMKFQKIDQDWVSIQTILMKDGTKPISRNVAVDEVCTSANDKSVKQTRTYFIFQISMKYLYVLRLKSMLVTDVGDHMCW